MLVLTRKASEQIQIGDRVVITILRVKGQSVRIGIDAPRDVLVLRTELPKFNSQPDAERTGGTATASKATRPETHRARPAPPKAEESSRRSSPLADRMGTRRADGRFETESRDSAQFLNAVRCAGSC